MQKAVTFDSYFRPADDLACFSAREDLSSCSGFFRIGPELICYGRSCGVTDPNCASPLQDVSEQIEVARNQVRLPFNPDEVVNNLRCERYCTGPKAVLQRWVKSGARDLYYRIRPLLAVGVRKYLQRLALSDWDQIPFPTWPVDCTVDELMRRLLSLAMQAKRLRRAPFIWFWPKHYEGACVVTHDVETAAGLDFCSRLMDCDDHFGLKSSFHLIPEERYAIPHRLIELIKERGFEVNIHDVNHDGTLFHARAEFAVRAKRLSDYATQFGAAGFRSGALYRDLNYFNQLPFAYDMSIPNVGHLEAQRGGCCTVMPYRIGHLIELPLTTVQDYSLFNVLGLYSTDLWREQIGTISRYNGLITILVHPDYLNKSAALSAYQDLLRHLVEWCKTHRIWMALPRDVACWWMQRENMKVVPRHAKWEIEGEGCERAQIRYATLAQEAVSYTAGDSAGSGNVRFRRMAAI